jgi:hypothetical protein
MTEMIMVKVHFNIILPTTTRSVESFLQVLWLQFRMHFSLPHTWHMTTRSHSTWSDHPETSCYKVRIFSYREINIWTNYLVFSFFLFSLCGRFFSFLILYTVSRTSWTGDQPVTGPLPTHRTTQTKNKGTQTSIPRVRLEPTIPVFERAMTVHALDRAATVIPAWCMKR